MRASSRASTVRSSSGDIWPVCSCAKRASSATASKVSTGRTGTSAPKASPWATAHAVRKPVKEPGPRPKTMASKPAKVMSACASRAITAGIRPLEAWAPPGKVWVQACSPRASANDSTSVLVSKANQRAGAESWLMVWPRPPRAELGQPPGAGAHRTKYPPSPRPGPPSSSSARARPKTRPPPAPTSRAPRR